LEVEEGLWEKRIRKDASAKGLGSGDRVEGRVYTKERKGIFIVERRKEVQSFVEDQLQKGYIRPSKSPQTSPVHFVAKKDGKRRMVQDYRHINQ